MAKHFFDDKTLFVPRIDDLTAVEAGMPLPAIIIDLPHTMWRPVVVEKTVEAGLPLIIDPVAFQLLYTGAKNKKNFKKLGYGQDVTPEELYSDAHARLEKIIKPAITAQVGAGTAIIVAPAFYSEDTDDIKFALNLTLLSETLRYLSENSIQLPVFASINLGRGVLLRPAVRNYIVDMYGGDFKDKIAGYFLTINDLDARKADQDHLIGLADLVFQLSKDKCIITKHVGAFGEALSAIGCSGFSSGLAEGESFSVKNLEDRKKGFGRTGSWTYVPEIFDYANDVELKKIGYKCGCKYCRGGIPEDAKSKKLHFLERRLAIMEALRPLDRVARIRLMKTKLQDAVKLVGQYVRDFGSPFKTDHLLRWITVLETAESWEHLTEDDETKLNALLNEIDNER